MSLQEDQDRVRWSEEIRQRSEFIEATQDALAGSIEFQTLAMAHAGMPNSLKAEALRQMADFAVLFVVQQERNCGKR